MKHTNMLTTACNHNRTMKPLQQRIATPPQLRKAVTLKPRSLLTISESNSSSSEEFSEIDKELLIKNCK